MINDKGFFREWHFPAMNIALFLSILSVAGKNNEFLKIWIHNWQNSCLQAYNSSSSNSLIFGYYPCFCWLCNFNGFDAELQDWKQIGHAT